MVLIHAGPGRSASTWLEAIFLALAEGLGLTCRTRGADAYRRDLAEGGLRDDSIYPALFLSWSELELARCRFPYRVLHVRRDPRDVLVSVHYALKYSHVLNEEVRQAREELLALSDEEGMIHTIKTSPMDFEVMLSYIGKGPADHCLTVEFGDLVRDPFRHVQAYLDFCGLTLAAPRLSDVLEARSFQRFSAGRQPGMEDVHSHYRKGVAGDWREKFTPRLKDAFKARYGTALIRLGYERGHDW